MDEFCDGTWGKKMVKRRGENREEQWKVKHLAPTRNTDLE